jgi:hypothetical protein
VPLLIYWLGSILGEKSLELLAHGKEWKMGSKFNPRTIGSRWTPSLAILSWTPISDFFLDNYRQLGISNLEAMLIIHLVRHKWTVKMPFPGFKRLAKRMGMTPTGVRAHARSLQRKGLLRRVKRPGKANVFDLEPLFEQLEQLIPQVREKESIAGAPAGNTDIEF